MWECPRAAPLKRYLSSRSRIGMSSEKPRDPRDRTNPSRIERVGLFMGAMYLFYLVCESVYKGHFGTFRGAGEPIYVSANPVGFCVCLAGLFFLALLLLYGALRNLKER